MLKSEVVRQLLKGARDAFVILGWTFFLLAVYFRFSGLAIYATTSKQAVEAMDHVWDNHKTLNEPGLQIYLKMG